MSSSYLSTCHACPLRTRPCSGPCPCTVDGIDIAVHAEQGRCPAGRYGDGEAAAVVPVEVRPQATATATATKGCGCGGGKRRVR